MSKDLNITPDDALLIVDVQNDFCPGGALPIKEGDQIIAVINAWIKDFADHGSPVFSSRDWHPAHHLSFEPEGGKWPPHCLQDTKGAAFHRDLKLPTSVTIVTKGVRFDQDQNSAFDQTGLKVHLRRKGIRRVFIAGLALDVCVLATAMDARKHGFEVVLIQDATRAVDASSGHKALETMRTAGVRILEGRRHVDPTTPDASLKAESEEPDVCLKAPASAEHQRFSDRDIPCDDGRAG
jgi:nicotinamidase/pyrazinamidase